MGRNGPNVEWVGLVVRTDDGQVHAVELDAHARNAVKITADLILTKIRSNTSTELDITAVIRGRGRYWREGQNLGPDARSRRQIGGVYGNAIEARLVEKGEGDGTRG